MSLAQASSGAMARTSTVSPFEEGRNHLGRDTLGLERESDFALQVAMPAHGLLFRSISVHDNFILDSVLAEGISFALRHCHCGS